MEGDKRLGPSQPAQKQSDQNDSMVAIPSSPKYGSGYLTKRPGHVAEGVAYLAVPEGIGKGMNQTRRSQIRVVPLPKGGEDVSNSFTACGCWNVVVGFIGLLTGARTVDFSSREDGVQSRRKPI